MFLEREKTGAGEDEKGLTSDVRGRSREAPAMWAAQREDEEVRGEA